MKIPCGEVDLEGDQSIPAGALGIVLFAHGSGSSRHSPRNQYVARTLREHRLGTLLFDLLTEAEERQDLVTGHFRFDIELLAERLAGAARWQHEQQPELPIGYFGSSTGGAAALMAAAQSDVPVRAIVSRGGRPDLAGPSLPAVKAPALLIVGGEDTEVIDLNRAALARLRCEKELRLVRGATHLFEEKGTLEQVALLAAEWFQRHFVRQ